MKSGSKLFFWNTLTAKKEIFEAQDSREVKMYNCGPTVYNFAHVGNLRAYVFVDILRRALELNGFSVKQVINITDVGHLTGDADVGADKIEEGAKREGKKAREVSEFYTRAFFDDLKKLNIEISGTVFPKATEHIAEQIELIKKLEKKGFTYKIDDGIYFDTSKFKNYGKLGAVNLSGLEEGARIAVNPQKRNPTDFALWKFSRPEDKREQEWPSPWGVGFPGWHIECSAMSMKYLGETLDIHTGGVDHIPVHHNNEIAQSEAATGKQFVKFWMHNAFVNMGSEKMAKSEGNFIRLETLEKDGTPPLGFKYWLLTAHYRSPITFSLEAIRAAETALESLAERLSDMPRGGTASEVYSRKFKEVINDDLDTPQAISLAWKLLRDKKIGEADKKATIFEFDKVLGLNFEKLSMSAERKNAEIPMEIAKLAKEREIARKDGDFELADNLRKKIEAKGYLIKDLKNGFSIKPTKPTRPQS